MLDKHKISFKDNSVHIKNIKAFDLNKTMECGQCFRSFKNIDGSYNIIAHSRVINVIQDEKEFIIRNANQQDFSNIWYDYFDLDTDYSNINEKLMCINGYDTVVDYSKGIRILKQDFFEMMVSFILSSRSSISLLKKMIELISGMNNEPIVYDWQNYFTFPSPEKLHAFSYEQLIECKTGYRARHLQDSLELLMTTQDIVEKLKNSQRSEARSLIKSYKGVGDKVGDCILLHSGIRRDVFPVDIWIKRGLKKVFNFESNNNSILYDFVDDKFGELNGYAEIYLFNYSRSTN